MQDKIMTTCKEINKKLDYILDIMLMNQEQIRRETEMALKWKKVKDMAGNGSNPPQEF